MKIILILLTVLNFAAASAGGANADSLSVRTPENLAENQKDDFLKNEKPLVLVELFTSEGCVSCPPADRVLEQLEKNQPNPNAEIVTLSLHVDYWNGIGWKDRFSSPLYSQRQTIYGRKFKIDSVYTPQMIVDGAKQFVGNNLNEANRAVSEAAKFPKAKIELFESANILKVNVSGVPPHADATVYLAIAEDDLSTKVDGGENKGRTLEHSSVARDLKPLGKILAAEDNFQTESNLQLQPDWKKENLKVIVFVQDNQSRKIIGINKILLNSVDKRNSFSIADGFNLRAT